MPRKCVEPTCDKYPIYNYEGEKAKYCVIHKLVDMIDVKNKRCVQDNCDKHPSYNYQDEKVAKYCFNHKLVDMIDVKNKRCVQDNCDKHPIYNYQDEKVSKYCVIHKLVDMIDVKNKRCVQENCNTRPTYNYQDEKVAKYCVIHKLVDMIDVVNKRCVQDNCDKHPSYNYRDEKGAKYCFNHKLVDMVDVKSKRCVHPNCNKQPTYNYQEEKVAKYCGIHKLENMVDIVHKRCQSKFCDIFVSNKNDGYCLPCYINLFPDKPVARNYKTKEKNVTDFVLENFKNITIITDKKVQDGCSKRRPDLLLDLGYQVLIVEIDENQHADYDCSCENKRIMELSQDLNHRPIIFIRFNPDDYKNVNNENITSCFGIDNRSGVLIVKKSKQKEWNERLNVLKNVIEYWSNIENKTNKMIEIIQLFYDKNV
jgi:hypothetical protein